MTVTGLDGASRLRVQQRSDSGEGSNQDRFEWL